MKFLVWYILDKRIEYSKFLKYMLNIDLYFVKYKIGYGIILLIIL